MAPHPSDSSLFIGNPFQPKCNCDFSTAKTLPSKLWPETELLASTLMQSTKMLAVMVKTSTAKSILQKTYHRAAWPKSMYLAIRNPLRVNTERGQHVLERISYITSPPDDNLLPTTVSCTIGQLERDFLEEGRECDLSFGRIHFALNPRFMELFGHTSNYFIVLADHAPNFFRLRLSLTQFPTMFIKNNTPYNFAFDSIDPTQTDVNIQSHRDNKNKIQHTVPNFQLVQYQF